MIRRNVLKLLGGLSFAPVIGIPNLSAKEKFGQGEIVRIYMDDCDMKYSNKPWIYSDNGNRDYGYNYCLLYNHKFPHAVNLDYEIRMKEWEESDLEILNEFDDGSFGGKYVYYHIVKYKNLTGYHFADAPLSKVKPTFRALETYKGTDIVRHYAGNQNLFKATREYETGSDIKYCVSVTNKKSEIWCPINKEEIPEKEMMEKVLSIEPYKYCHIIRYKDEVGYLFADEIYLLSREDI